jgi:hypothetical protein
VRALLLYFMTFENNKKSQLMDYMVSLLFIDFIFRMVLDKGPLYCITLWLSPQQPAAFISFSLLLCPPHNLLQKCYQNLHLFIFSVKSQGSLLFTTAFVVTSSI